MSVENKNRILKTLRQSAKFVVIHSMDEVATGQELERLPKNKITIYPPFETLGYLAVGGFLEASRDIEAINAQVGSKELGPSAYFGENNDVLVRQIDGESAIALRAMHMLYLARFRGVTKDLGWSGQNYNPHITLGLDADDLGEGSSIVVDSACLMRKMEDGKWLVYQADRLKSAEK